MMPLTSDKAVPAKVPLEIAKPDHEAVPRILSFGQCETGPMAPSMNLEPDAATLTITVGWKPAA